MGERNSRPNNGSGSRKGQFMPRPTPSSDGWRQAPGQPRPQPPAQNEQPPSRPGGSSGGLLKKPFPARPGTSPARGSQGSYPPYEKAPASGTRAPSNPSFPPTRASDQPPSSSRGPGRTRPPSSPGWSSG